MTPYGQTPLRGIDDGTTANVATINYKARGESVAANRAVLATKVTLEDSDNSELMRNGTGIVSGVIDKDNMDSIIWEGIVRATSRATAIVEANLPIKHTVVALSDYVDNNHTFLNGDWAYHGGGKLELAAGEDEDTKITLPLKRYRKADGSLVALTGAGGILVAQS